MLGKIKLKNAYFQVSLFFIMMHKPNMFTQMLSIRLFFYEHTHGTLNIWVVL